jgi:hypothetical protein
MYPVLGMRPSKTVSLGFAATCLVCGAISVAAIRLGRSEWWPRNPPKGSVSASPAISTSPSASGTAGTPRRTRITSLEDHGGRANYEFMTTLPCPEDRGSGRFAIDAGFQDMFGCDAKDECSVSAWGAIRRRFKRLRFHADERGSCVKHPDSEADCLGNVCVVPSDRSCSPGLFADAGSDQRDLDAVLGIPNTERQTEERLFVITEARAREGGLGAPGAEDYWTPSFEDVKQVDSRLREALAVSVCDSRAAAIAPRLPAYRAQFVGVVQHGKRRILGNYVCTRWIEMAEAGHPAIRFDERWLSGIEDGGECFFHFWYDPRDKSIHALSINGEG